MSDVALAAIARVLDQKYLRGEALFRQGDMRSVVDDLYTEDAQYVTPRLRVLRGREAIFAFFEAIKREIGEVKVYPVCLWGDPQRVVYQLCNTVRRAPGDGAVSHAHYIAAFRKVGTDWLCEMEVVAPGHIEAPASSHAAAAQEAGA